MRYKSLTILLALLMSIQTMNADSPFGHPVQWRVGAEVAPAYVLGTNGFLKGMNAQGKRIDTAIRASIRADFSFSGTSSQAKLYPGLYQGIGIGPTSFMSNSLLGTPVSAYIYQGAPIVNLSDRFSLGYEWKFGAAIGWKHFYGQSDPDNAAISTPVTAHMAIAVKLNYRIAQRWEMALGIEATHFSNGNTSMPNAGINSIGGTLALAYSFGRNNGEKYTSAPPKTIYDSFNKWFYDIMAFGAWRKRIVSVGEPQERELCPGKFAVAGLQFSPMRQLNQWVAVGPALDLQWDESGGLAPYWVEGSTGENIKFRRPPFLKQISVGISAHAELTTPIFAVNAGVGYDILNPEGDKRFFQSLTLKVFVTSNIFLNIGYRLGNFKDPQNLMLGTGIRLH